MKKIPEAFTLIALILAVSDVSAANSGRFESGGEGDGILDVGFSDCRDSLFQSTRDSIGPARTEMDFDRVAETMHGVWVGEEILADGTVTNADYGVIFDMEEKVALAFHHEGTSGPNRFDVLADSHEDRADSPRWESLLCDGWGFRPMIHRLYRVSETPSEGLRIVRSLANLKEDDEASVEETWEELVASGFLFEERKTIILGAIFRDIEVSRTETSLRIDWMADYLGSPDGSKELNDEDPTEPLVRAAGGGFQVVRVDGQEFLLGTGSETWRYLNPGLNALPDLQYTKVVLGPIEAD